MRAPRHSRRIGRPPRRERAHPLWRGGCDGDAHRLCPRTAIRLVGARLRAGVRGIIALWLARGRLALRCRREYLGARRGASLLPPPTAGLHLSRMESLGNKRGPLPAPESNLSLLATRYALLPT